MSKDDGISVRIRSWVPLPPDYYDAHIQARKRLILEYFTLSTKLGLGATDEEHACVEVEQDALRRLIQGQND